MANLDSYFQQVDSLQDKFIDRLREAVAIPSISSEDQRRPDVVKVRLAQQLRKSAY
jgi:Cys-Gly metallodipeptidase DUG1